LVIQIILREVYLSITIVIEQSSSKHRQWVLKKSIALNDDRSLAMKIEKAVKKSKSRILIEKIILEINNIEELAQLVRVPMYRD